MKLIKDLGYTDLDGKHKIKRYFVIVECPICNDHITIRKERLTSAKTCKSCVGIVNAKNKQAIADNIVEAGNQTCTKCNETKDLSNFHKDNTKLSGYRKVCKTCRYNLEKEANAAYLQTEAGKHSSAARNSRRRALIKSSCDGTVNVASLTKLKQAQNNKCHYCGNELDDSSPRMIHLDHIVPLSKGGCHSINNVVWSCQKCNLQKSDKQ